MGSHHTVYLYMLPITRHKWTHPDLTPARGRYSIYLPGRTEGWVDLGDRLYTEMVYPPTDGLSILLFGAGKYQPQIIILIFNLTKTAVSEPLLCYVTLSARLDRVGRWYRFLELIDRPNLLFNILICVFSLNHLANIVSCAIEVVINA